MKRNTKFLRVYDSEDDDPRLDSKEFEQAIRNPMPGLLEEVLKAIPRDSIVHAILTTK